MIQQQGLLLAATVCAALGLWLMLPRAAARGRRLGILFAIASLVLFFWRMPPLPDAAAQSLFLPLAVMTVVSCAASITARNPVYTAIWFGLALLATAGLFMLQGAQFLGVATVVVYAGAILVTFLFVLMLAQPEGHAFYDRLGWETLLSAITGAVVLGILVAMITSATHELPHELDATQAAREAHVLGEQHVARLGGQLFSRHLIAVEVGGMLLLAALVGAVAIVAQGDEMSRTESGAPKQERTGQGRARDA